MLDREAVVGTREGSGAGSSSFHRPLHTLQQASPPRPASSPAAPRRSPAPSSSCPTPGTPAHPPAPRSCAPLLAPRTSSSTTSPPPLSTQRQVPRTPSQAPPPGSVKRAETGRPPPGHPPISRARDDRRHEAGKGKAPASSQGKRLKRGTAESSGRVKSVAPATHPAAKRAGPAATTGSSVASSRRAWPRNSLRPTALLARPEMGSRILPRADNAAPQASSPEKVPRLQAQAKLPPNRPLTHRDNPKTSSRASPAILGRDPVSRLRLSLLPLPSRLLPRLTPAAHPTSPTAKRLGPRAPANLRPVPQPMLRDSHKICSRIS